MKRNAAKPTSASRTTDIVRALEEEIAQLAPKERLVEEDLSERFKVKRHVVRQALSELETMGVVRREPNRGATVRHYGAEEVEQLYLVRALVERTAAELISLPATPALVRQLSDIHDRHCAAVKKGDLRRVFRENLLFHKTFFAACGNSPLVDVIEQLALKAHAIRSYSIRNPELLVSVIADHAKLIKVLQGSDRDKLMRLVVQHIQPAKETYLKLTGHAQRVR
jgi:DNA-binding GntR family transcriptional regulator